jgi:hypothetical protein
LQACTYGIVLQEILQLFEDAVSSKRFRIFKFQTDFFRSFSDLPYHLPFKPFVNMKF